MCWRSSRVGHVLTPVLGAGRVSARVITFRDQGMQIHVHACVKRLFRATLNGLCIRGFACRCMHLCVYQVQSWYLSLLPCIESRAWFCITRAGRSFLCVFTYQKAECASAFVCTHGKLDMYLHSSSMHCAPVSVGPYVYVHMLARVKSQACHCICARLHALKLGTHLHLSRAGHMYLHATSCSLFSASQKQGQQQKLSSRAPAAGGRARINKSSKVSL
jgi:hypothetical protein